MSKKIQAALDSDLVAPVFLILTGLMALVISGYYAFSSGSFSTTSNSIGSTGAGLSSAPILLIVIGIAILVVGSIYFRSEKA